ncbi:MAG TPA: hypothetical protein VH164_15415 [Ktedonobacteraceae bacterium]|jgi:hypothetical protein|nr:hypothetical protein [Ktedonobacteraceae bacterium]
MNTEELLAFLEKGKTDEELMLMCQAAVDEMGPQEFMQALKPAADDALALYEERLTGIQQAYRQMQADIGDRVIRVGILAGTLLDAPLDKLDIVTSVALLVDWLTEATDQVQRLTEQNSILDDRVLQLEAEVEDLMTSD